MKQMHDMVRISKKFDDKLTSFCAPLIQMFGISQFYHAHVSHSGHFIGVNMNRDWEEYFFSDKSHLLIWPDKCQPCKSSNGIRLLQEGTNESLNHLLRTAKDKYSLNFSLQFVEKSNHGTDMYGFALNSPSLLQHMLLLKEAPLLRLFIKQFREEFKPLYLALHDHQVDMTKLLGSQFYKVKNPAITEPHDRDQFLKRMHIETPPSLTPTEVEIIKYLIGGSSASEIASLLFRSKRTVEHHIERIKDKFFSISKSELIKKIREFELIGYFAF